MRPLHAVLLLGTLHSARAADAAELIAEARALAKQGELDRAEALLQQAEGAAPGEALMLKANIAAFLRKDQARATELYRASMAADATRWDSRYFLGRVLSDQQRWDEAIEAYQSAAELNPKNVGVLLELGQAQTANGGFAAGAASLLRAAALDVHSAQPLLVLAQTSLTRGEPAAALSAYEDVSELHPWHAQPMMQLASLRATLEEAASGTDEARLAEAAAARSGAPSIIELRDAALSLQPSVLVPAAVSRHCEKAESKLGGSRVAPNRSGGGSLAADDPTSSAPFVDEVQKFADEDSAVAHAKAVGESACAFLKDVAALASRAVPAAGTNACVVRLPAGRAVRFRAGSGGGVIIPSGTHLTVEADGEDEAAAVLDAGCVTRHFIVASEAKLTLRGVGLRGGRSLLSGGGSVLVLPGGSLEATSSAFVGNRAVLGSGGAIASRGASLVLRRVRFAWNEATLRGGALSHASYSAAGAAEELLHTGLTASARAATATLESVEWVSNRAGRAGDDVMLCAGATLTPRPAEGQCALSELLEHASAADPFSPNAFSFHLNFLYTHAMDAAAAERLAAFARAVPEHTSLGASQQMLSNASAPMLHQRGQTLNGQLNRMREGTPPASDFFTTRLQAQDAATSAFVQAISLTPNDGQIWYDLGTSLFFAGELAESSLAYKIGVQNAPRHEGLQAEATRAAALPLAPPSADQITIELFGGGAKGGTFASEFTAIPMPEGSYGSQPASVDLQAGEEVLGATPRVFVSLRPLLPKPTCERYIAAAEAWATRSGGWTTSRHYAVATTDIPLTSLPELLPSFNEALGTLLLPALSACYPEVAPLASRLRVLDCFLVRYDANRQASLPVHTDQSLLSFTIALNDPTKYEGGGTFFRGLGRAIDAPAAGHAVLFPGKVEHGGHPISKGVRYIIVLFMGYESNRMSNRTAGYSLQPLRSQAAHSLKDEL